MKIALNLQFTAFWGRHTGTHHETDCVIATVEGETQCYGCPQEEGDIDSEQGSSEVQSSRTCPRSESGPYPTFQTDSEPSSERYQGDTVYCGVQKLLFSAPFCSETPE